MNIAAASAFKGGSPKRGIKQRKFSGPFATFYHMIIVLFGLL